MRLYLFLGDDGQEYSIQEIDEEAAAWEIFFRYPRLETLELCERAVKREKQICLTAQRQEGDNA
jgi:hypothetical protein